MRPIENRVTIKINKISISELKNNWIGNNYSAKVKIKDTIKNITRNILILEKAEYT